MSPAVHEFESTSEAYDAVNVGETFSDQPVPVRNGDVLVVPSERVVGVAIHAWPTAITAERGCFHFLAPDASWSDVNGEDYSQSYARAVLARTAMHASLLSPPMDASEAMHAFSPARLTITGLDGPPSGRLSRSDMGAAARALLTFPTTGAFYGGLTLHGPQSNPNGRDCGCSWGDLCPRSGMGGLCDCERWRTDDGMHASADPSGPSAALLPDGPTEDDKRALNDALQAFKSATAHLSGVWQRHCFSGDEMAGAYPECLPSFDELSSEVTEMRITRWEA
ncbi:MAG: hypothetical protein V7607_1208 [Solirubrobacteraceae bacterium]